MKTTICTLFEGHYHLGVAVLTNSLYANGFRGTIYAGYRGNLPPWAKKAPACDLQIKEMDASIGCSQLQVADGTDVVFVPLNTDYHLTNYKPDFMLNLLDGPAKDTESIFYFDPDIVVNEKWRFFEEWVTCGIALCEDVNSPLPENHPRRIGWRRYFGKHGFALSFRSLEYVNGGFIGLKTDQSDFLRLWQSLQLAMAPAIGGLRAAKVELGGAFQSKGFCSCFDASDQDTLNAAVETSKQPISVIGQEAMGFQAGATLLPHALGSHKPWKRSYLLESITGRAPRRVDKVFWQNQSPIKAFTGLTVARRHLSCSIAAFIGRFIHRA